MNDQSYYPTYFSIEDIMVTQEKVPCKTNVVFPRLGYLSSDNEEEDLKKDTSLSIPVWLARKLLHRRMNFIRVEVPNAFKEKARDVFEADATVVNLFRVSPNFFEFGLYFSYLKHRDSELIRELLIKVFRRRFKMILDWSIHRMTEPSKIQQLDLSEQRILKAGQKASELLDEWFVEAQFKMKPAEMVVGLKKRKLLQLYAAQASINRDYPEGMKEALNITSWQKLYQGSTQDMGRMLSPEPIKLAGGFRHDSKNMILG